MKIKQLLSPVLLLGSAAFAAAQRTEFDFTVVNNRVYTIAPRYQVIYATTESRCKDSVDRVNGDHQRILTEIDDLVARHIVTKEEDITWLRDNANEEWNKDLDVAYEERDTWVRGNLEYVANPPPEFHDELVIVEVDVVRNVYRPNHRVWFECDRGRGGKYNIVHVEYKRPFEGYAKVEGPHGVRYGEKIAYDKRHVAAVHTEVQRMPKLTPGAGSGHNPGPNTGKPVITTKDHKEPIRSAPNSHDPEKHGDPKSTDTSNSKTHSDHSNTSRQRHDDPKNTGPSGTDTSNSNSKGDRPSTGQPKHEESKGPGTTGPASTPVNHDPAKPEEPKHSEPRHRTSVNPDKPKGETPRKPVDTSGDKGKSKEKDKEKGKGKRGG